MKKGWKTYPMFCPNCGAINHGHKSEDEKIRMCDIVSKSDADFIKTSTGFSTAGATFADVALMKAHMTNGKGIKAAGGIANLQDAEDFMTPKDVARLATALLFANEDTCKDPRTRFSGVMSLPRIDRDR